MAVSENNAATEALEAETAAPARPGDQMMQWVATCLFDGYDAEGIVAKLVKLGTDPSRAEHAVGAVQRDPVFAAGMAVARRRAKLASLLDAQARQLRQSPVAEGVPVLVDPSPREFFEGYYFANRPVLVKGLMDDWPALGRWKPGFFAERFGATVVEVTADRESDPLYEDRFSEHRRQMPLGRFVELIEDGSGNDLYIVAKNRLLDNPEMAGLLEEFESPPGFLNPTRPGYAPRLWLGGAGTVTPLHHDGTNIFFGQLHGRKLVRLIPGAEIEHVYNDRACFSAVDLDAPDYERFPELRDVLVLETVVEPGDFLLLPLGWWHAVRSLEVSVSLSFQDFALPTPPAVWRHGW